MNNIKAYRMFGNVLEFKRMIQKVEEHSRIKQIVIEGPEIF